MARLRTFFLQTTPDEGAPTFVPSDKEHALKVLRVRPGDRLMGIDGAGKAWKLEVTKAERRRLVLEALGAPREEAAPGAPGSPLPWIEVWAPLPKRDRAEDLIGQLTQLGVARYVPLVTAHTEPQARELPESRTTRLERTAREALKQCGRLWMPRIGEVTPLAELEPLDGKTLCLDPGAEERMSEYLNRCGAEEWPSEEDPIRLVFGPEGGFNEQELEFLSQNGSIPLRIAKHVLRIETAALSALAIVGERWS